MPRRESRLSVGVDPEGESRPGLVEHRQRVTESADAVREPEIAAQVKESEIAGGRTIDQAAGSLGKANGRIPLVWPDEKCAEYRAVRSPPKQKWMRHQSSESVL